MRPTYANLVAILSTHPNAAYAEQVSGLTAEQMVYKTLDDMAVAPNAHARDRVFSRTMAAAGIYTTGVEAFDRVTEQMLQGMGNRDATERESQRMSEQSRHTPQYVSPERIAALRDVAAQSSLTQGLNDKMRATDRHREQHDGKDILPKREDVSRFREDRRDLRSALGAAVASSSVDRSALSIRRDETRSLRDTLSEAFDADDIATADRDPLTDDRLLSMSDAI